VILESVVAGLFAGVFGALVGLGGGILMVPVLTLLFGLPMSEAIPASLVGVVATAMGGTASFLRTGYTDTSLAIRAGAITVLGAMIGARLGVLVPERALQLGFALLVFVIVWRMFRGRNNEDHAPGDANVGRAFGLFLGAGLLAGMLGVGGGILNVPAIRLALKRTMIAAVATSTMIVAFTGTAGATMYASAGMLKWSLAAGCATGAFVGGRIGAAWAPRVPRKQLQQIFMIVIIYVGIEMAVRGLELPWWR